jgi:signal transduction histidine kinase
MGITGMEERARLLQGVLSITSGPGQGTSVSLEFKD